MTGLARQVAVNRPGLCLALVLLSCLACVPPLEQHGGAAPLPAKVSDAGFAAIGATFDAGLQVVKVPLIPRLAVDAAAAITVRTWRPLGRTADSGFLFLMGTFPTTVIGFVGHAIHQGRAARTGATQCQYAGMDGRVHAGTLFHGECR